MKTSESLHEEFKRKYPSTYEVLTQKHTIFVEPSLFIDMFRMVDAGVDITSKDFAKLSISINNYRVRLDDCVRLYKNSKTSSLEAGHKDNKAGLLIEIPEKHWESIKKSTEFEIIFEWEFFPQHVGIKKEEYLVSLDPLFSGIDDLPSYERSEVEIIPIGYANIHFQATIQGDGMHLVLTRTGKTATMHKKLYKTFYDAFDTQKTSKYMMCPRNVDFSDNGFMLWQSSVSIPCKLKSFNTFTTDGYICFPYITKSFIDFGNKCKTEDFYKVVGIVTDEIMTEE